MLIFYNLEPEHDFANSSEVIKQSIKKLFDAIESEGIEACSIILIDDGSTDKTVEQDLDGMKLGLGLKKETGFGFIKIEYSETDYDDISATTSNNTKVTADIDTEILALSVAKSF